MAVYLGGELLPAHLGFHFNVGNHRSKSLSVTDSMATLIMHLGWHFYYSKKRGLPFAPLPKKGGYLLVLASRS